MGGPATPCILIKGERGRTPESYPRLPKAGCGYGFLNQQLPARAPTRRRSRLRPCAKKEPGSTCAEARAGAERRRRMWLFSIFANFPGSNNSLTQRDCWVEPGLVGSLLLFSFFDTFLLSPFERGAKRSQSQKIAIRFFCDPFGWLQTPIKICALTRNQHVHFFFFPSRHFSEFPTLDPLPCLNVLEVAAAGYQLVLLSFRPISVSLSWSVPSLPIIPPHLSFRAGLASSSRAAAASAPTPAFIGTGKCSSQSSPCFPA